MRNTMGTLKGMLNPIEDVSHIHERTHDWRLTKVDLIDDEDDHP
jgi:hypothetical protein